MSAIPINAMASAIPPAPVIAILSRYRREEIEGFIEIAIGLLDMADGDADLEGAHNEDELSTAFFLVDQTDGPGCKISDPDFAVDDQPCDAEVEDGL